MLTKKLNYNLSYRKNFNNKERTKLRWNAFFQVQSIITHEIIKIKILY